jgi:RNA polymerase sigma factor for flagellar operon FliA
VPKQGSVTLSVGIDQGQESVVNTTDITGIAQLWADFKASRTREARDRLIVHYSPLVKYVAGRVAVGLPQNVE